MITQDFADVDLGLNFCWPKHHNFSHILNLIRRKGPADNYETGLGESLHPQTKTDYARSSGQPDTVDTQVIYILGLMFLQWADCRLGYR